MKILKARLRMEKTNKIYGKIIIEIVGGGRLPFAAANFSIRSEKILLF